MPPLSLLSQVRERARARRLSHVNVRVGSCARTLSKCLHTPKNVCFREYFLCRELDVRPLTDEERATGATGNNEVKGIFQTKM